MIAAADLELANRWQRGFPLASRPFREIGAGAGLSEEAVIARFSRLQRQGVLDRIGPVFRPGAVGASSLGALAVPPRRLAAVARAVTAQPGINHNYEREHRYNLWFVATAASEAGVEATFAAIERASGLPALRLPLVEEFHVDLGFDLHTGAAPRGAAAATVWRAPNAEERSLLRATARGLALEPEPYARVAHETGIAEEKVIAHLARMLDDGRMRRLGAVIRHRRVGYAANAMAVWDVPDEEAGTLGRRLARDAAVTLCYRRLRAAPQWTYNLYCMVHGQERARVLEEVQRLDAAMGGGRFPRAVLFSRRCFAQRAAQYG